MPFDLVGQTWPTKGQWYGSLQYLGLLLDVVAVLVDLALGFGPAGLSTLERLHM
jgi:hypothetical protein